MTGRVQLAEIALERLKAGDADRDIGQPLAPRPSEGVGHDDGEGVAGQAPQTVAQRAGGAVGVLGQEARGVRVDVGLVDARVGADQAMMGLDDEDALVLAHDAAALAEDHLGEPRIAADLLGDRACGGRGGDLGEPHHAPLGLGDDLLAHDEQVPVRGAACPAGRRRPR